jgi:23S rRNA pseudouridine1911/1915/1917 synthase
VENARDLLARHLAPRRQKVFTVHRIDRFTSGLMVFAKHRKVHAHLVKQFLAHTPLRRYLALVRGQPDPPEGELRHYLKLTTHGFRQVVVRDEKAGGRFAVSRYRVLEAVGGISLVEVELVTGLKNQIRVQLAEAGTPVVGDRHYVEEERHTPGIDRQALHATRLGFIHPATGKHVEFTSELPPDLARLLESFRRRKTGPGKRPSGSAF